MFWRLVALLLLCLSSPAMAGPPYATDDPAPADPGTVESYLFVEGTFAGGTFDGEVEAEFNYGAAPDLQLSIAAPISFAAGPDATAARFGNVEVGAKWRFHNNEASGVSVAFYPSVEIPTGAGARGVEILLPLWAQWESGGWTLFGGGGRRVRTASAALDSWEGGIALTRDIADGASVGIEATVSGRDAIDGHGEKTLAVGGTVALGGPFTLIGRVGPVFEDDTGQQFVRSFIGIQGIF